MLGLHILSKLKCLTSLGRASTTVVMATILKLGGGRSEPHCEDVVSLRLQELTVIRCTLRCLDFNII